MYADPVLEARVLAVAEELRCLVCQNETIAASQADLAVDLREQIRIKLQQGQSQQQILDFMALRYGDFVLYRPRFQASTLALWLGPFALLVLALWVLSRNIQRRRSEVDEQALSAEDMARAAVLLEEAAPAQEPVVSTPLASPSIRPQGVPRPEVSKDQGERGQPSISQGERV